MTSQAVDPVPGLRPLDRPVVGHDVLDLLVLAVDDWGIHDIFISNI